jgi:hypothetical protein
LGGVEDGGVGARDSGRRGEGAGGVSEIGRSSVEGEGVAIGRVGVNEDVKAGVVGVRVGSGDGNDDVTG